MRGFRVVVGLGALLIATALLVVSLPAVASATVGKPTVVLDPDDNFSHGLHDGVTYTELPITYGIAQAVQAQLTSLCDANVSITRDASQNFVDRSARATQMAGADVAATLSLNGLYGVEWGTQAEGGSSSFATSTPDNLAFGNELVNQMHAFTGRPFAAVNQGPVKAGLTLPYPEFAALPGTYAHFFMLYIDHTYDWEVIKNAQDLMVNAVVTALAHTLQAKGFQCLGTFPSLPSAARLQQLRNLGYARFLRYAAEPVSMSTGNFSTAERTFSLSGVGTQAIDLTLDYNAQSAQDSPIGFGWSSVYSSYMQQYSDGSVAVFLPDGHALLFVPDGSGGFTAPPGAFSSLTQVDNTTFKWTTTTGTSMTFTQDSSGRGMLTSTVDRQGNTETLAYSGAGALFPSLNTITDQAGQVVQVGTDGNGRITSFTRPDGAAWQLGYSAAGDLTSLTSARGTVRSFNYDGLHRMTSEIGQDGVTFLTNTYDSQSRVVGQTNAFGNPRSISYDDTNRQTTYTDATGASGVYSWNALGQITAVQDALGGVTTTNYNADLLPTNQTDQLSHTTVTAYDLTGQPSSVTDPLGNSVTSTYDASGDLTSHTDQGGPGGGPRTFAYTVSPAGLPRVITNPDATTQSRTYDSSGDLTSSTDENGAVTSYAYDSRGNVISVTDPLGRVTTLTYDLANRETSVTDPLGHTTSFAYDANNNLTQTAYPNGSSETRSYDINDQLTSSTDRRGATTTYGHDAELNVVSVTLPNGGVIHNTFDQEDRLTSTTDPLGNKTSYTLDPLGRRVATTDANGHTTHTVYDAAGQVVAQTDASGASTSFARDAKGQLLTTTDALGDVTTNTWDNVGRRTSVTDPLGHTTTSVYNFRDQVTSVTDPAGGVTTSSYDPAGRLVKRTDASGAITTFAYDAAGQLVKKTDALGGVTTFAYDAVGNQVSVTDPNGHTSTTTYDDMNQPASQTDANGHTTTLQRDPAGLVTDSADPLAHHTGYGYDSMGNLTLQTDPLGRTTKFGYDLDGHRTATVAPDGVTTASQYDPVGNLIAVTRNARLAVAPGPAVNVKTSYSYDPRNLLMVTTDPNGGQTKYGYDLRGLRTSETNPLGKVTAFTYDAAGNRASRTDANGIITTYAYDPRNLLTGRTYSGGTSDTYTYDAMGRQVTATNAHGTVATTYDLLGRPTKVTDAAGKALSYSYDAAGNRTQLVLPDGRQLNYTYDAVNWLTRLNSPLGDVTMTYDQANRPSTLARSNGTATSFTFDNANELTRLETNTAVGPVASFIYTYDTASNVATRAQTLGGVTKTSTYSYDPLRRLVASVGGPLPSTYAYDAAGNRLTWSAPDDPTTPKPLDAFVQTNVVNAAGQVTKSTKVRQNGGSTVTDITTNLYENNGNRVRSTTVSQQPGQSSSTSYLYDFENRLAFTGPTNTVGQFCGAPGISTTGCPTTVADPLSVPTNNGEGAGLGDGRRDDKRIYDAEGRLIQQTVGLTNTTWTQDGVNPIMATDVGPGNNLIVSLFLRDDLGQLLGHQTGADSSWYITDMFGSVFGTTNSAGKATLGASYSDYGASIGINPFRFGFDGQLADRSMPGNGQGNASTDLSHYFARSYDPLNGNWLQPDTYQGDINDPTTLAKYQFVGDNPTGNTDPLGYLSVGVANPGTISGVSVATGSWSGSLQGGVGASYLQPTVSAQSLQPTISAQQLQPTANPFVRVYRSPAAYGQAESVSYSAPVGGLALQGTISLAGGTSGSVQRQPGSFGYQVPNVAQSASDFFVGPTADFLQGYSDAALVNVSGYLRGSTFVSSYVRYAPGLASEYEGLSASDLSTTQAWAGNGAFVLSVGLGALDTYRTYQQTGSSAETAATAVADSGGIFASAAGAAIGEGAAVGLVCGPGAPVCSGVGAAAGGVIVGGLYAWQAKARIRNWVRTW